MAGGGSEIGMGSMRYGKAEVRLVKVARGAERHDLRDLTVAVALSGDFRAAYEAGDNRALLATDTMRNTIYALAQRHPLASIEAFGLTLVDHFLAAGPTVEAAEVRIVEHLWRRIEAGGRPHAHSFVREAGERTAAIHGDSGGGRQVQAGIDNLLVLKTTNSGWENFYRDAYTTLPDTSDRILATNIRAEWTYGQAELDFDRLWTSVRATVLETFTDHYSPSVQHTLYRMGRAVLQAHPEVARIHFALPNRHHLLYDLGRFGLPNNNEIFHATSEPYGLIEGTVERR
jgi:urate oxidase